MKRCLIKVKSCLNSSVKFRALCDTKKILFYSNIKSKVPHDQKNHVICKIKYPTCNGCNIGKTERCLIIRIIEAGTKETEPMFKHLFECEMFKEYYWLHSPLSLFKEK